MAEASIAFMTADTTTIIIAVAGAAAVLLLLLLLRRRGKGDESIARVPPPAVEAKAPAAEPVQKVTEPVEAAAAEAAVPQLQPDAPPVVEAVAPAAEQEAPPAVEEAPPVAEEAPPAVEEAPPAVEEAPPVAVKEAPPVVVKEEEEPAKTLRDGLDRTRKEGFIARLGSLFAQKKAIDDDLMDEVEEVLFTADIGVRTANRLLTSVREALSKKELKNADKVWQLLRSEATEILKAASATPRGGAPSNGEPRVIMVLGVNGTGKTTSIGKLAHQMKGEGKAVQLIAGDTFRAAAAEQLEHWGRKVDAPVHRGDEGADPASVVFDGVRGALDAKADVVLVDTAGRLHTQKNLMEELKKVRRVMGKAIEGAPHEVLMVLDATTGQNAINQAKLFDEATDVTGIILTKLDGTAKGGVVLGVCDELKIPIRYIGIGERVADLRDFDSSEFVNELFAAPGH